MGSKRNQIIIKNEHTKSKEAAYRALMIARLRRGSTHLSHKTVAPRVNPDMVDWGRVAELRLQLGIDNA